MCHVSNTKQYYIIKQSIRKYQGLKFKSLMVCLVTFRATKNSDESHVLQGVASVWWLQIGLGRQAIIAKTSSLLVVNTARQTDNNSKDLQFAGCK